MARLMMYVLLMVATVAATERKCYEGIITKNYEEKVEKTCEGSCERVTLTKGLYITCFTLCVS